MKIAEFKNQVNGKYSVVRQISKDAFEVSMPFSYYVSQYFTDLNKAINKAKELINN